LSKTLLRVIGKSIQAFLSIFCEPLHIVLLIHCHMNYEARNILRLATKSSAI